ncbi:uncharacterized protein DC041_0004827 [Schistosoma bovis]|uniref:Post-GPI attachment to proteins factor 3 n=1 Tax=Schistosoma bovis TaxID=6184 RepID=A0A430QCM4_SCHBO|nr:uncharacterized protein DC041_0004827 [Schistosoma bovis]
MYFDVIQAFVYVLLVVIPSVVSSVGDRTLLFHECNQKCREEICESSLSNRRSYWDKHFNSSRVVIFENSILWDCESECKYRCMWNTVSALEKNGWPVPQFNGKWPFIRLCGIQEPASAIFSLLNFMFNCHMFNKFYRYVPYNSPMYKTWVMQIIVFQLEIDKDFLGISHIIGIPFHYHFRFIIADCLYLLGQAPSKSKPKFNCLSA